MSLPSPPARIRALHLLLAGLLLMGLLVPLLSAHPMPARAGGRFVPAVTVTVTATPTVILVTALPTRTPTPDTARNTPTRTPIAPPIPSATATAPAGTTATRTATAVAAGSATVTRTVTAAAMGSPTATVAATQSPVPPTATATPPLTNIWTARAPYPIPIQDEAVVAQGGLLYSFGGSSAGASVTNAYRYDPTTDRWTALAALPEPLAALSAVSDGTVIYLLNGSAFSHHLYRYDPAGDGYTALLDAPTGTYAQTAAYLNGALYRIGGQDVNGATGSVEVYNAASAHWTSTLDYPQAAYFLMTAVINGQLYGAGGAGATDLAKAYGYDAASGSWDDGSAPDLPATRWGAASGVLGGKWLLAGGNEAGAPVNSALLWDPAAGGWQALPPMLQPRYRLSGAAIGAAFYAVGGLNPAGTPTTNTQQYLAACGSSFSDVHASDYFAVAVQYLACRGILSGYDDGTFRPGNPTTRAQLAKIIVGGEGWALDTTGGPHFSDVAVGSTFYSFIETAFHHGIISGYNDGTFRPSNPVTRGQLSKIIVAAQGWALNTTGGPHFNDVATGNVFYPFVETALSHHIISGYSDGTFRPGNPATRGQIAKIVYLALTSGLHTKDGVTK